MKILITGGAGFIGSHLADRLLENSEEVYVIDDLSSGTLKNVEHLQDKPKFHLVVDTVLHEAVMNELVFKCECIYHMAAVVGVKQIMNRPVETLETNVKGTEMVLRLANSHKKKVLIASTSEVYGKVMDGDSCRLLAENTDRLMGSTSKRRWAYACSKALDEFLALAYYEEKKLPVVIARLFNTVGPRQIGQYGMVVPNFVQKALIGKPIVVHGDGSQSRTFIHISDAVDALMGLMGEPSALGQVVNVGSTEEVTIKELALLVKELTNSKSDIEYISYEKAYGPGFEDMKRRCPDISKIRELIGFQPKVNLRGIIQSVIDYYTE
jgi:UDP-glucose 4-epimerase